MTDQPWNWTAAEMARAVRSRAISSVELLKAVLSRVDEVNPRINAIVDLTLADAMQAAESADEAVRNRESLGPLHGVPVTVKINVDYQGRATPNGVVAFTDPTASAATAPAADLRTAGRG